jgi:hypothetical protein
LANGAILPETVISTFQNGKFDILPRVKNLNPGAGHFNPGARHFNPGAQAPGFRWVSSNYYSEMSNLLSQVQITITNKTNLLFGNVQITIQIYNNHQTL